MKKTRRIVQVGFLVFILSAVFLVKGNVERWCPFGGVETLYSYYTQGNLLCSLAVSNLYILAGLLLVTLLVRRVFCGYACPIGTLSEWLALFANRLGIKSIRVPYRVDRTLALLKYVVLGLILYFAWRAGELAFRAVDPCYAIISRHGDDITLWAYLVAGLIAAASFFFVMPFCRWFCPMAAVLNIFSKFGFSRIKRDPNLCVNCGKCAKVCPMAIHVDKVQQVTSARCLSCMKCIDACPKCNEGALIWGMPHASETQLPKLAAVIVLLAGVTLAVSATYLFPIPSFVQSRGSVPQTVKTLNLEVKGLTCRGTASLFVYFLERDDDLVVPGYLKIEAWPGPGWAKVRIGFDATTTTESAIKQALAEPYFDGGANLWRDSPFEIKGYDSLSLP
jgi:ferredoxin